MKNHTFPSRHCHRLLRAAILFSALLTAPSLWATVGGVSATLDDNVAGGARKNRGDTITNTVQINNTGVTAATSVTLTIPTPANAADVAGSVHASPIAFDDAYTTVGNTKLYMGTTPPGSESAVTYSAPGLTNNDTIANAGGGTDTITFSGFTSATTQGGSVTVNANGTFTYTPAVGFTGADTFTYTIANSADATLTGTGTVTITVTNRVWYADNTVANGNGTSASPFNTLAGVVTPSAANDYIYLYNRAGTVYTGGIVMKSGQQLIGNGTTLTVGTNTLRLTGTKSTLGSSPGNTITLAEGVTVSGLDITSAGAAGISGTSVSNATIAANVNISGTASAGVSLSGGNGTITVGGAINVNAGRSVSVQNRTGGTVTFSGAVSDSAAGILLNANTGATINFTGTIGLTTGANTGFSATGGGTISATGANSTILTTSGTALNVANTTIGASGLTFRSISAGTGASGPASGIVLTSTGSNGGLTVTGDGNPSIGGNSSGGTIQHTSGVGIALTSTLNPSFADMNIHNTTGSGVAGTSVNNFTFKNCTVNQTGSQNADANIAFNSTSFVGAQTQNGNNISGTLTIIGNTLINGFSAGLDIQSDNGAVTDANVSNNTVTGSGTGTGALSFVGTGNGTTVFDLNNATIANNTISGQKADGIQIAIGNSSASGPVAHAGFVTIDGSGRPVSDPSHIISIIGNSVTAIDPNGAQAITVANSGGASGSRTQTNFEIKNNGTIGTPLGSSSQGTVILVGNNGFADMAGNVANNVIVATQTANLGGGNGIAGGNGVGGAGNAWTPRLFLTVTGNSISGTDGNDILLVGRGTSGQAYMKVANNNVSTPVNAGGTARECIRIDAGNTGSADDAVFLTMTGNTCQLGSNGAAGLGIRKNGTTSATVNDFGITGLSPSPATGPQAASYVATQNPAGNGCDNISGALFTSTTLAPP